MLSLKSQTVVACLVPTSAAAAPRVAAGLPARPAAAGAALRERHRAPALRARWRPGRQVQQAAVVEVGHQQSGPRPRHQISQGVEEEVADVVGHRQAHPAAGQCHPDKTRPAAAVRDVDPVGARCADPRGIGRCDEERVCAAQQGDRARVQQRPEPLRRRHASRRPRLGTARVDVLRAIAEALQHLTSKPSSHKRAHPAVGAVAPARMRLQPQQADRGIFDEPRRHRVVVAGRACTSSVRASGLVTNPPGPCSIVAHGWPLSS